MHQNNQLSACTSVVVFWDFCVTKSRELGREIIQYTGRCWNEGKLYEARNVLVCSKERDERGCISRVLFFLNFCYFFYSVFISEERWWRNNFSHNLASMKVESLWISKQIIKSSNLHTPRSFIALRRLCGNEGRAKGAKGGGLCLNRNRKISPSSRAFTHTLSFSTEVWVFFKFFGILVRRCIASSIVLSSSKGIDENIERKMSAVVVH